MDFVELNPILDHANKTGELTVSLICSVLGKRVFRVFDNTLTNWEMAT
jgi:arginase